MDTVLANLELAPPITELKLMEGGVSVDDRGLISFVNGFDFKGVKRFYLVQNHTAGFIRAWHAHKREGKYVSVLRGAAIVGAVSVPDVEHPHPKANVSRFILSASKPAVVAIPPGYANGAMTLTNDSIVVYFSTSTLQESARDDFRYDARFWDAWSVEER